MNFKEVRDYSDHGKSQSKTVSNFRGRTGTFAGLCGFVACVILYPVRFCFAGYMVYAREGFSKLLFVGTAASPVLLVCLLCT